MFHVTVVPAMGYDLQPAAHPVVSVMRGQGESVGIIKYQKRSHKEVIKELSHWLCGVSGHDQRWQGASGHVGSE